MEIIDKLFIELGHFTKAKTKREVDLEDVIIRAIRIKDLWLPSDVDVEHENEARALGNLYRDFCKLVEHIEE